MFLLGRGMSPIKRAAVDPSLKGALASCVFDLDATRVASYAGSGQTWLNIVSAPADGAASSAYNFALGVNTSVSTDDPTFIGTAGATSAYFLMDGGDCARIATMPSFMNNLHKTTGGTNWTIAVAFRFITSASSRNLFNTRAAVSQPGISFTISATDRLQLGVCGDTVNVATSSTLLPAPTTNTDVLWIISYNGSSVRQWLNSRTNVSTAFTPNASVADASGFTTLGGSAVTTPTGLMPNGTRIYAMSGFNAFIADTDAAKIFDVYNARHGRTYA